jgi:hypothetical protein
MRNVAAVIDSHHWGLFNAVVAEVPRARTDGVCAEVKVLTSLAGDFRTKGRHRTASFLRCNNLDISM